MQESKTRVPSDGTTVDSSTNAECTTSSHTNGNTMLPAVVSSTLRPILFSTEMVKAILEGRKTQTRRVVKSKSPIKEYLGVLNDKGFWKSNLLGNHLFDLEIGELSTKPYASIGDILWVRETWQKSLNPNEFVYKADTDNPIYLDSNWKWKPSLFMPFDACRLFLKVTNIRVEKLQDISESDAINEGIEYSNEFGYKLYSKNPFFSKHLSASDSYMSLWEKINGKENWDLNPYVWVIEFERCSKP